MGRVKSWGVVVFILTGKGTSLVHGEADDIWVDVAAGAEEAFVLKGRRSDDICRAEKERH